MEITIDIVNRTYEQIKEMCDFNGIAVERYVLDCVLDNFNIMKYGDLNEKFKPKEEVKAIVKETPKIEEEKPKTKVGRPRKVQVEEEVKPIVEEIKKELTEEIINPKQTLVKKEEVVNTTDSKLEKKLIRTRKLSVK